MRAVAQAQPNIALIKYWGKRDVDRNLPAVDSLSVTLDSLWTRMSLEFDEQLERDTLTVNGSIAPSMLQRVSNCLDLVAGDERARARVESTSNFPIGAGLASSASAFAALVVAADEAAGTRHETSALARLAGAASGSAARSLFAGFVELTAGDVEIEVRNIADCASWPLTIIVAVTAEEPKPIGSTNSTGRRTTKGLRQTGYRSRAQLPENALSNVGFAATDRLLEPGNACLHADHQNAAG